MNSQILNVIGVCLVSLAMLLHIICIAEPHHATADVSKFVMKVYRLAEQSGGFSGAYRPTRDADENQADWASFLGKQSDGSSDGSSLFPPKTGYAKQQIPSSNSPFGDMDPIKLLKHMGVVAYFGLWQFCEEAKIPQTNADLLICATLDSDLNGLIVPQPVFKLTSPGWLKASAALSIIGLLGLAAGLGMTLLSITKKSKGDRLRLMYIFSSGACFIGAILIFAGDIIFASNYTTFLESNIPKMPGMEENQMRMMVTSLLRELFSLGWAFGIDICSAVLALVASLLLFVAGRMMNQEYVG